MAKGLKEVSRTEYPIADNNPTFQEINTGAIQRIADSLERMEKPYLNLLSDVEMYKRWYKQSADRETHLRRCIASLKGQITKMRKQA